MKQISIIIPVYNSKDFINKCLDSLLLQVNRSETEIIVVDDGSTDETPQILKEYSTIYDFIRIVTQENQKQSAARNNGLKHATGKYVMFVDSDDYPEQDMIPALYKKIEEEKTDLCICGIKKIFNNRTETEIESCLKNSQDIIADYLSKHQEMDVGLWNKIFKRDIIEKPLYNLVKREESTTTSYSPEIEKYSNLLIQKISEYLVEKDLRRYETCLYSLKVRNLIHIVHHNIKYNKSNKRKKIKQLIHDIKLKSIGSLPKKYQVAILLLKIYPSLYEKMYERQKSV